MAVTQNLGWARKRVVLASTFQGSNFIAITPVVVSFVDDIRLAKILGVNHTKGG